MLNTAVDFVQSGVFAIFVGDVVGSDTGNGGGGVGLVVVDFRLLLLLRWWWWLLKVGGGRVRVESVKIDRFKALQDGRSAS